MNRARHLSITAAWLAGILSFAAWGLSDDGFDERAKGSGSPAVVSARFTPSILRFDRTTPFTLTAKIGNGVADRVVLTQENGSETAMRDDGTQGDAVAGDGVYTVQLPAALAVAGLQADDVYRKFIGYIDAYVGTSRASRYNTFASIWGAEMGVVNVVTASATAHYSNYVLNIVDPTSFAAGPGDFQSVVSKLYQVLPDQFDFVDVVFDGIHVGNRFHFAVRNDVSGLGMAISNNGGQYGSASRLKGISAFPVNNIFDTVDPGHSHEIGHQWINFLKQAQLAATLEHLAHAGLLVLMAVAGGVLAGPRALAPGFERRPLEPFARSFVYFFALVPVLVGTLLAVLAGRPSPVGGAGPLVVLSGLAVVVAAGDVIRLHRQRVSPLVWLALLIAPPAIIVTATVTLPWTVSPPALARKVVPGWMKVSSSKLMKKESLSLTIGPESQPPHLSNSNVPGLTVRPFASVPTRLSSRNQ
ncbi:MAG: hypothetical protein F9K47_03400 [Burkholderiales bacterium]|nr:MAG: hypothetical protein F9K47_03400 [Burkholderiales bacterium]